MIFLSYTSKYTGQEIDDKLDQVDFTFKYNHAIQAGTNLNDIVDNGVYIYTTSNCPENAPYSKASVIYNFGSNSNTTQKIQLGFRYGEPGKMSFRPLYQGEWLDWKQIAIKDELLDMIYPIGSIYQSTSSTSPASFLGGTWEALNGRFLIAQNSTYAAGSTGGNANHTHTSAAHTHTIAGHTHSTANHTLTVNEIPSHKHTIFCGYSEASNNTDAFRYQYWAGSSQGWADKLIGASGGGGAHNHGNTGSTTLTTNSTTPGATGSSSNMPPYLSVYMWKRIN